MFRYNLLLAALASLLCFSALAEPITTTTAVALERHDAGTFYIEGAIDGYGEVQLLVDTGSSLMVISETMLDHLKATGDIRFSHELRGVMADGTRRGVPVYRLSGIRLGKSCWIREIEAAVFPGSVRPVLGMNILARLMPFTFSVEPPQLALSQCQAETSNNIASVSLESEIATD